MSFDKEVLRSKNQNDLENGVEKSLTDKESVVLSLIKQDLKISKKKMSEQTGYPKTTIDRIISSLKRKGALKGKTADKCGVWILG